MTDIADKIYAATGLTLSAEAAAAIGQMIQAESEKLREAVKMARQCIDTDNLIGAHNILTNALGGKQ
jgi:hypothetical protein